MLEQIIQHKRQEVTSIKLPDYVSVPHFSLKNALVNSNRKMALISEVKKASPSKGVFVESFNPTDIAKSYEAAGADAISCLTDQRYFQGHRDYVTSIKKTVKLPVLRKDFIIDSVQVEESARIGADAILLIAATLDPRKLHDLYLQAYDYGLECLVEIHSVEELDSILNVFEPQIIGINNRKLKTFETTLSVTLEVIQHIPNHIVTVSESGIKSYQDIQMVENAGIDGVLVGETLMKAQSPEIGIQNLFKEASRI